MGGLDNATFLSLGNNYAGIMDSTILNYYNPATYNLLSKGQPLFSFGISSRISFFTQNDSKEFDLATSFQHFAMAFPIKKHFGFTMGIKPFSSKGYDFYTGESVLTDSIVYNYRGTGSLNEAFGGFSTDLLKLENTRLAVGMNAGYVFGETKNMRRSYIYSSTASVFSGGIDERVSHLSTFHYDLGFYLNHKFRDHEFTLSGRMDPSQKLKGNFDYNLFFSTNINNVNAYDTVSSYTTKDHVTSATSYEFGLTYKYILRDTKENSRKLNSEILVAGSFGATKWSNFSAPLSDSAVLLDATKFSFGVQFTPEVQLLEKMSTLKFYQKIHYRIGGYMYTLPYSYNGTQVSDKALTFGFGIPVPTLRSLSSINLGFSLGKRGTNSNSSLNENYYGINLGITIAPGITERWFRNLKLNP